MVVEKWLGIIFLYTTFDRIVCIVLVIGYYLYDTKDLNTLKTYLYLYSNTFRTKYLNAYFKYF